MGSFYTWCSLPKTWRRVVMLLDSPCGVTSKAATVAVTTHGVSLQMETNNNFFILVAKLHVSSQLRWRSLRYRHRCCRATSSMKTHLVLASLVELLVYWILWKLGLCIWHLGAGTGVHWYILCCLFTLLHGPKNIALIGPSMVWAQGLYWLANIYNSKSRATSQCASKLLVAKVT